MKKWISIFSFFLVMFCLYGISLADEDTGVKILEQVGKNVVRICGSKKCTANGWGTGFFINDRYIVTNHHVVSKYIEDSTVGGKGWFTSALKDEVLVCFSESGNDFVTGTVVQDWPEVDLAVLQIPAATTKKQPVKMASENMIKNGMKVFIVGFPGVYTNDILTADDPKISDGVLSSVFNVSISANSKIYQQQCYSAMVNPGNSGGPVVNSDGYVIGIANSSIRNESETGYFGISLKELTSRLTDSGIRYTVALESQPSAVPTDTVQPTVVSGEKSQNSDISQNINIVILIFIGALSLIALALFLLRKRENDQKKEQKYKKAKILMESGGDSSYQKAASLFRQIPGWKEADSLAQLCLDKVRTAAGQDKIQKSDALVQGVSGQFKGFQKTLSREKDCLFGRDPMVCSILFDENHKAVSRRHCRIHYSKTHQCFVIQDLNSSNGTILVRGSEQRKVPSDSAVGLKDGDLIYVPDHNNIFRVSL